MRGSRTVAERRAASRSSSARGSSAAITWRATCRSRMRSCARQNRPSPLSLSRSTSRYRSASTSPARVACGTVLPSGLRVSPEITHRKAVQARDRRVSVASTWLTSLDPQQPREDQEQEHVDGADRDQPDRGDHGRRVVGQSVAAPAPPGTSARSRARWRSAGGRRRPAAGGCAARRAAAAAAGRRRPNPRRRTRRRQPTSAGDVLLGVGGGDQSDRGHDVGGGHRALDEEDGAVQLERVEAAQHQVVDGEEQDAERRTARASGT